MKNIRKYLIIKRAERLKKKNRGIISSVKRMMDKIAKKRALLIVIGLLVIIAVIQLFQEKEIPIQDAPQQEEYEEEFIPTQVEEQKVYIADTYNHRIQVFDKNGAFLSSFGSYGREESSLRMPTEVMEYKDKIYVLDKGNNKIKVFDKDHHFILSFGEGMQYPLGFDIGNDQVYVTNTYESRIDVFSLEGKKLFSFGSRGRGEGQFRYASDVAVDDSRVYVIDTDNNRVEVFTHDGKYESTWGKFGPFMAKEQGMRFPLGIEVYKNTVYVSDTQRSQVKMYAPDGTLKGIFGTHGKGDDQFRFESKIWEVDGLLYIADTKNNRIKAYYPNGTLYTLFGSFGRDEGSFRAPGVIRWFNYDILNKTVNSTA